MGNEMYIITVWDNRGFCGYICEYYDTLDQAWTRANE